MDRKRLDNFSLFNLHLYYHILPYTCRQLQEQISVSVRGNEMAGTIIVNDNLFEDGETATAIVLPNDNYEFLGWLIDGEIISTNPEYSVVMNKDIEIEAMFENVKVDIFPNPVKDNLTVECDGVVKIIVMNSNGTVVGMRNVDHLNSTVVNTKSLKSGSYILNIITDRRTFIKKFIKM